MYCLINILLLSCLQRGLRNVKRYQINSVSTSYPWYCLHHLHRQCVNIVPTILFESVSTSCPRYCLTVCRHRTYDTVWQCQHRIHDTVWQYVNIVHTILFTSFTSHLHDDNIVRFIFCYMTTFSLLSIVTCNIHVYMLGCIE